MRAMSITRVLLVVALVGSLAACTSAKAEPKAAPPSTSPPTTSDPAVLHLTWTMEGPAPELTPSYCDAAKHCVVPATEKGSYHGDLEGTKVAAGGAGLNATNDRFATARIERFDGTVKGCGTGSIYLVISEVATTTSGTGTFEVVEGFGTGGLAHLTGHGSGSGTVDASGIHGKGEGEFRCR